MRPRLVVLFWLAQILSGCSFGFPAAYVPRSPAAQDFPDVGAAVLEDVATLEYRVVELPNLRGSRLAAVLDHRRRIKILNEHGLAAADVELPVDGYSTITRVVARSVAPDVRISNMGSDAVTVVGRPKVQERAPDVKLLRFHIPDVQVGGLVEYRYERVYLDPYLVPPWVFGGHLPVLHAEFGLIVPPQVTVDYRFGYGSKVTDRAPLRQQDEHGGDRLVFIEKDLPSLFSEPMMPHITRIAPWIALGLRSERLGHSTHRMETWDDVGRVVLDLTSHVRSHPAQGTLPERYRALRRSLTPITLPGLGVRQPQTAEDLLSGTPACSRDATALLLRSFTGTPAKTFVALLTGPTGPPAVEDFPSLYAFTAAVGAVEVTPDLLDQQNCGAEALKRGPLCGTPLGGYAFVDATCKTCPFGVLPPRLQGRRALLMNANTAFWVDRPADPPQRNTLVAAFKLQLDEDGAVAGVLDAEARGHTAVQLRDTLGLADNDAPVFRDALFASAPGPNLAGIKINDPNNVDVPLMVHAQVTGTAEKQDSEHVRLRVANAVGRSLPNTWPTFRRTPALLDGPSWHETSAEVQLPVGYGAEVRPALKVSSPFADYAAGFSLRGQTLHFSRRLVVKVHEIQPDDWPAFADFVKKINDYEQDGPSIGSQE